MLRRTYADVIKDMMAGTSAVSYCSIEAVNLSGRGENIAGIRKYEKTLYYRLV